MRVEVEAHFKPAHLWELLLMCFLGNINLVRLPISPPPHPPGHNPDLSSIKPKSVLREQNRVVTRNGAMGLKKILSGKAFIEACCLEPDALGKAQPEKETTVPATQKVLIRDQLAKRPTGKDYALLPTSALTQIEGSTRRDPAPVQMYSLIFDEDQICYAGGLELLCPANPKRSDSIAML